MEKALFANRILKMITLKTGDEVLPNARNWRVHPERQRAALGAILKEVGQVGAALAYTSERNGGRLTFVDGHLRHGIIGPGLNVLITDLNDAEADMVLLTHDPLAGEAEADKTLWKKLVASVKPNDDLISDFIKRMTVKNKINRSEPGEEDGFDEMTAVAPKRANAGDVWLVDGIHRVMVGDAENPDDVARLFGEIRPAVMVTDPPYGVKYDPMWREAHGGPFGNQKNKMRTQIQNDHKTDWTGAYKLFPGQVAYIWHADKYAAEVLNQIRFLGEPAKPKFELRSQIIWAKPHFILSRGHYHFQHEPCFYLTRKGKPGLWNNDTTASTLWEIAGMNPAGQNDETKYGHGSQKPIECFARAIRNHGNDSHWIYDPFAGSGSSLIAAHQSGRKIVCLDNDAACVDMILLRAEQNNLSIKRLENGKAQPGARSRKVNSSAKA